VIRTARSHGAGRTPLRLVLLAPFALPLLAGCGAKERAQREALAAAEADAASRVRELPHAAFIRFEEVKGEGLSRESWSVEILQADSDIWMTASVRSARRSIPVKEPMSIDEFQEIWSSLRGLQLDQLQLHEDLEAPETGWKKALVVDVVESSNKRIQSRHSWSHPLKGHAEIDELEKRFQNMLVAASERELGRQQAESDSANAAMAAARARSDSTGATPAGN
jgi:hypothetical protein